MLENMPTPRSVFSIKGGRKCLGIVISCQIDGEEENMSNIIRWTATNRLTPLCFITDVTKGRERLAPSFAADALSNVHPLTNHKDI